MERMGCRRNSALLMKTFRTFISEEVVMTKSQLKSFEKVVDDLFGRYDMDFDFTNHFLDRINDDRNNPRIKVRELSDLIKKIYMKRGRPLKDKADAEVVVRDKQSNLNIPAVVTYDKRTDDINVVAKTIMRKKDFRSPDPKVEF